MRKMKRDIDFVPPPCSFFAIYSDQNEKKIRREEGVESKRKKLRNVCFEPKGNIIKNNSNFVSLAVFLKRLNFNNNA